MNEVEQNVTVMSDRVNTALNDENADAEQYVTFVIADEIYGVEVLKVQEIIGMTRITHVPNSLNFMRGMINLRGSVVPVVDMRIKFKMDEREYDSSTVILIVEIQDRLVGMIVDSVADVVNLPFSDVQNTPHFSAKIDTDYIKGIGKMDDQLIIVLDVDLILKSDELQAITEKSA